MVNKQDGLSLGCWDSHTGNLSDEFYQKYPQDSSKIFPEQTYNTFMGSKRFSRTATNNVMEDLDTATSDSSDPDLLWQFSQIKLNGIANGAALKAAAKPVGSRQAKSSDARSLSSIQGLSPLRKPCSGSGLPLQQKGRQGAVDGKRRSNGRK
ncbi:hypothetical protein SAY86_022295 [Trapa natans]|uniref:Uncharacterized protein n=1 Tax=Trapa natans TaxID=22666 RepID=A0AAN7M8V6_TRANT|nr:hypothetical protein SAY86_022295 [Trapa natans]